MKPKILICIKDGMVETSCANMDCDIIVVDYDCFQPEDDCVSGVLAPDAISENIYELFTDQSNPQEIEIRDKLKRLKF